MKTETDWADCKCDGSTEMIDEYNHSQTLRCIQCGRARLVIRHREFELTIPLSDFHLERGPGLDQRPVSDLKMATNLWHRLVAREIPSRAQQVDFGIDSSEHVEALHHATVWGILPYELDRVIGDGPAITALVNGIPKTPYPGIRFATYHDNIAEYERFCEIVLDEDDDEYREDESNNEPF